MVMRIVAAVVTFGLLAACGGGGTESATSVTGVVDQVTGDGRVEAFVIVDDQGNNHRFTPAPGLLCGGQPLAHLRTHLVERDAITVEYRLDASGAGVAVRIDHGGG